MTHYARSEHPGDGTDHPSPGRRPTFTSWLRSRSDEELTALLRARPDLAQPVPADIGALANRATSRNAVLRALERLDGFTLQVLESVVALGDDRLSEPVGALPADLAHGLGSSPASTAVRDALDTAVDTLSSLALVWPDHGRWRPVQVLRELLPHPARLGPPVRVLLAALAHGTVARLADDLVPHSTASSPVETVATALSDPDRVGALVGQVDAPARRLLDSLAWGPPNGTVTDARREVALATASSPVESLIARGLLVPTGDDTLTLPREVGLFLRSGVLFREVDTTPPAFEGRAVDADTVARAAAGQAFVVLRAVEELMERWSREPAAVLRNGGLGVRDLRRAAQAMDTDDATATLYLETARAAGLLATDDRLSGEWLPTREYDLWRESPPERRWLRLVRAWLDSDRAPSLAGSQDTGGRVRNVLGPGLVRPTAPQARRDVLAELGSAEPGLAPDEDSLRARLTWRHPRRRSPLYTELVAAAVTEATALGMIGMGALAAHSRPLIADDEDASAALLAPELPQPLDYVLVQGDMTAVAPGPLVTELARELALTADVESTGGATVYRFTEASVRRALDAGRGVADLTSMLERHSRTPLPQALRYLVSDVGRRHGRLRAGTASSYLRCDEPALLTELVGDRRAADLELVALAPTVVVSGLTRAALMERLRHLGYHPVAESGDGVMRLSRPEVRRAEPDAIPAAEHTTTPVLARAAVRALRAGDEAATIARVPVELPDNGGAAARAKALTEVLERAAADERRVWIGYTDTDGRQVSRIVAPSRVDGGFLTAYDTTRDAVHRFALHRITGVAELSADTG
ncbi:helicase-associated domain-containing protein [Nocardiopsis sp. MG754419]|uniref:helicase-associated domain-containing protein n=1 Tax=Nocardiopsis sp. MG754419 TaxID=2259865 RepID=UPI001BA9CC57|nr:helicase-associated domain-containing protein [Nocardiopsis sp. MG754419]MBR8742569.1 helicase [Nocardiopsis sp. MG754419]